MAYRHHCWSIFLLISLLISSDRTRLSHVSLSFSPWSLVQLGIEILLNNSESPHSLHTQTWKKPVSLICIFTPEFIFQVRKWVLWVAWSLGAVVCCCVLECKGPSLHLQPSLYVFSCTSSSTLPSPASEVCLQFPVKTQFHFNLENKLLFGLFQWMSEVN